MGRVSGEKRSASRYSCVPPRVMTVGQTVTWCAEPHGRTMHMQSDYDPEELTNLGDFGRDLERSN